MLLTEYDEVKRLKSVEERLFKYHIDQTFLYILRAVPFPLNPFPRWGKGTIRTAQDSQKGRAYGCPRQP